ncbi:PPID, partial [Symbiodinium sp. KB8]
MASGSSDSTSCEPINSGYAGTIQISCFFGVLTANPSGCSPKPCAQGDQLDVTLDGATSTITLGREVKSGTSTTAFCSDVNSAWGDSFTLSCNLGTLSFDVSSCQAACTTSATMDVTLADSTVSVSPTATLLSGETEFNIPCSGLNSGYTGVYTLSCVTGDLAADTSQCTERGCLATDTVDVTVGSSTNQVAASEALSHG